jgi:hypothetical protein
MGRQLTVLGVALALLTACVTINIYFPTEKVESVADEIVHEIRGGKANLNMKKAPAKPGDQSWFEGVRLAFTVPAAWAGDVTAVSNPTIRALKERMKRRFPMLRPYLIRGVLKENPDGYLSMGDTRGLNLKQRRDIKALMDAENRDRDALYTEVAKALNIDIAQKAKVARIFAKEWIKSLK